MNNKDNISAWVGAVLIVIILALLIYLGTSCVPMVYEETPHVYYGRADTIFTINTATGMRTMVYVYGEDYSLHPKIIEIDHPNPGIEIGDEVIIHMPYHTSFALTNRKYVIIGGKKFYIIE